MTPSKPNALTQRIVELSGFLCSMGERLRTAPVSKRRELVAGGTLRDPRLFTVQLAAAYPDDEVVFGETLPVGRRGARFTWRVGLQGAREYVMLGRGWVLSAALLRHGKGTAAGVYLPNVGTAYHGDRGSVEAAGWNLVRDPGPTGTLAWVRAGRDDGDFPVDVSIVARDALDAQSRSVAPGATLAPAGRTQPSAVSDILERLLKGGLDGVVMATPITAVVAAWVVLLEQAGLHVSALAGGAVNLAPGVSGDGLIAAADPTLHARLLAHHRAHGWPV